MAVVAYNNKSVVYYIVHSTALYILFYCFVYYIIKNEPKHHVINNVVSMQRPPYCIVPDDL